MLYFMPCMLCCNVSHNGFTALSQLACNLNSLDLPFPTLVVAILLPSHPTLIFSARGTCERANSWRMDAKLCVTCKKSRNRSAARTLNFLMIHEIYIKMSMKRRIVVIGSAKRIPLRRARLPKNIIKRYLRPLHTTIIVVVIVYAKGPRAERKRATIAVSRKHMRM